MGLKVLHSPHFVQNYKLSLKMQAVIFSHFLVPAIKHNSVKPSERILIMCTKTYHFPNFEHNMNSQTQNSHLYSVSPNY